MKKLLTIVSILLAITAIAYSQNNVPLPSKAQLSWHESERIMFVHWGMATWQNREYDKHAIKDVKQINNSDVAFSINDCDHSYLQNINIDKLNTDQWCDVARSWGAKMIIFVAKHTGGFCWWQTNTTNYGVKELNWKNGKGDVMRDLSNSCKKYGLKLGVYIYPGDDHWGAGIGSGGVTKDTSLQQGYNAIFRQQLTEVLSRYGDISEVWFDGNCKIPVKDILDTYAPNAVVFQGSEASLRWVGNENGIAPYPNWYTLSCEDLKQGNSTALSSDINGECYAPVEIDVPLLKNKGHKWFWSKDCDSLLLSVEQLMNLYYKSVGRGSVLLLNSTPDTTGLIPQSHYDVYKAFGKEIAKRFDNPISFTHGKGNKLVLKFSKPQNINHVIIEEDLQYGQRVLEYEICGKMKGKWYKICNGKSIGSKRIEFFKDTKVTELELVITKAKGVPHIKRFASFNVQTNLQDLVKQDNKSKPIQVGYWDKNSFVDTEYREIQIDLTEYANTIGEYLLSFNQISMDYFNGKSSTLEFKEIEFNIYGQKNNDFIRKINDTQFLITNSQQTLKEFPIIFKTKIKHSGANSVGEITLQKLEY